MKSLYFQHPWTVGFTYPSREFEGKRALHCSGSIIEASTIITAAHCFDPAYEGTPPNPEEYLTVIAGAKDLNDQENQDGYDTVTAKIKGFIIHPGYKGKPQPYNDIAIVRLTEELPVDIDIFPICLPDFASDYKDYYMVSVFYLKCP